MQDPETYTPKYVDVDDVPVSGPDQYDTSEKKRALFKAESRVEMDLNGGTDLRQEQRSAVVSSAITELATYYLTRSASSPADATYGDMTDDGNQDRQFAEQFRDEYERLIDSISEGNSGSGAGSYIGATDTDASSTAVNTRGDQH